MSFVDTLGLGVHLYFDPGAAPRHMREFGRQVTGIRTGLSGMARGLGGMMGGLSRLAATASLAGAAVTAMGVKATSSFMDFDDEIRKVGTALGPELFAKVQPGLREMAKAAAKDFGITHVEAASAMKAIAKQGVVEMDAMRGFLKHGLALSVGDTEIAADKAMEVIMNVAKMFNESMTDENLRRIADQLLMTANLAATNVTEIKEAFKYIGPIASSLRNLTKEEMMAGIGMLSERGIKGSLAGTTLARIFGQLGKTTSRKMQAALGISATDASGALKTLVALMAEYADKLKDIDNEQDLTDAVIRLAETRGARGVFALMPNVKALEVMVQKIRDSEGTAMEATQTRLEGLKGQWGRLKSAVADAGIEIVASLAGRKAGGALEGAVGWVNSLATAFETMREGGDISHFSKTIQAIVNAVREAPGELKKMWTQLGNLKDKFVEIVGENFAAEAIKWGIALAPIVAVLSPILILFSTIMSLASGLTMVLLGGGRFGIGLVKAMYALGAAGTAGAGATVASAAGAGAAGAGSAGAGAAGFRTLAWSVMKGAFRGTVATAILFEAGRLGWTAYTKGWKTAADEAKKDLLVPTASGLGLGMRLAGVKDIGDIVSSQSSSVSGAADAAIAHMSSRVDDLWRQIFAAEKVLPHSITKRIDDMATSKDYMSEIGDLELYLRALNHEISKHQYVVTQVTNSLSDAWSRHFHGIKGGFQGLFGLFQTYKSELISVGQTALEIIPLAIINPANAIMGILAKLLGSDMVKGGVQKFMLNAKLCRDALAGGVSRHQMELSDRAGATTSLWQRRQIIERDAITMGRA